MRRIYFDSNIYAEIIRRDIKSEQIKSILIENKFRLFISSLNLFEMASCWKLGYPSNINQGIKRFQLIKELLPCRFLNTIPDILLMEIDKAINNADFSPFCDGPEKESFEKEINKLAQGIYDDTAKRFINNKWKGKISNIQKKISELTDNKDIFVPAKEFQDFLNKNKGAQQLIAETLIHERVLNIPNKHRRRTAEKILRKSSRFPLIASVIKASLFLDHRVLKFRNLSHDTLDDLKHLINASYADIFVTGDGKLYDYSKDMHPDLEILSENDLLGIKSTITIQSS